MDTPRHAATIWAGEVGVLHGARTFVLQDDDGQTVESHSISAGLDYPGVGPQHAHLAATGRATYRPVTDAEAMEAMALLARTEGIIPAIESAHAVAGAVALAAGAARADRSWSTSPAAATRTWARPSSGSGWARPRPTARPRRPPRSRSPRARSDVGGEHVHRVREDACRRPGRPGGLPPGRLPRRGRRHRGARGDGRRGLRRDRGRPALQRPGDGRPHHPGRRPAGARGRRPHHRRDPHGRGGRRHRRADRGDDLLEPGRALRRRSAVRARPRARPAGRGRA